MRLGLKTITLLQFWKKLVIRIIILFSIIIRQIDALSCSTGNHLDKATKKIFKTSWKPLLIYWLKCITDASQITVKKLPIISYVNKDDKGRILHSISRRIGDVPVSVAETLAIWEALRVEAYLKMGNLMMESDSQIVINSILRITKVPRQILIISRILLT